MSSPTSARGAVMNWSTSGECLYYSILSECTSLSSSLKALLACPSYFYFRRCHNSHWVLLASALTCTWTRSSVSLPLWKVGSALFNSCFLCKTIDYYYKKEVRELIEFKPSHRGVRWVAFFMEKQWWDSLCPRIGGRHAASSLGPSLQASF